MPAMPHLQPAKSHHCKFVLSESVITCVYCKRSVPITEDDLAVIGNDLSKVHRICTGKKTIDLRMPKPGDILAVIFSWALKTKCQKCKTRQKQMNQWGWLGCWRNSGTILAWICQSAWERTSSMASRLREWSGR